MRSRLCDSVGAAHRQDSLIHCILCRIYDRLVAHVAHGRNMSEANIRKVAEGRVWTGRDAMKHGLVDSMGGLSEAIAEARRLAGLTEMKASCDSIPLPDHHAYADRKYHCCNVVYFLELKQLLSSQQFDQNMVYYHAHTHPV